MPNSQIYTPPHCFFCNFAGWEAAYLRVLQIICSAAARKQKFRHDAKKLNKFEEDLTGIISSFFSCKTHPNSAMIPGNEENGSIFLQIFVQNIL